MARIAILHENQEIDTTSHQALKQKPLYARTSKKSSNILRVAEIIIKAGVPNRCQCWVPGLSSEAYNTLQFHVDRKYHPGVLVQRDLRCTAKPFLAGQHFR
ncbi:MAG TPA: hypothetical protein VHA33_27915 [Candidatus Angelobacter sp.]|nr:hypothetical protein [Candidatus Angelobacter sp.]